MLDLFFFFCDSKKKKQLFIFIMFYLRIFLKFFQKEHTFKNFI